MKVLSAQNGISFERALKPQEKKEFDKTVELARNELKLGTTTATIFDFSIPTSQNDTGIGTSFSEDAQKLAEFLKTMAGVNAIQLAPQGEISNYIRSPYSGTSFSLGMHLIDLNKLSSKEYGSILTKADYRAPYFHRTKDKDNVDYDNVFGPDGQKATLKTAYKRFEKLPSSHPLKIEYEQFKKDNSYWLERDVLFEAAAIENGSLNINNWSDRDKYLFADGRGDIGRIAELKTIRDDEGNRVVDLESFIQFLADKQQKEAKLNFNQKGIDIYGDCQIGFSQKDVWTHMSAFRDDYEFGCEIGDKQYTCWSPAIDFDKLDGDAGELLYNKFKLFFRRYNGVRIDAAWQLIKPLICAPIRNENGNDVFDLDGHKLGTPIEYQPEVADEGAKIIQDIILRAADEEGVPHNKIFLEMLGGNSYDSLDAIQDTGVQLIHITKYAGDHWGRVKFYEAKNPENKFQNMKRGEYTIGPGTHDDESLIEQFDTYGEKRALYLAKDLKMPKTNLTDSFVNWVRAVFSELFTTKNQFATLPDILGSDRRINDPTKSEGNWLYRARGDYEDSFTKTILPEGRGLNIASAYSDAIKAKNRGKSTDLTDSLDKFSKILSE